MAGGFAPLHHERAFAGARRQACGLHLRLRNGQASAQSLSSQ
jgi:hypothetical protein